ncbi:biotin--[acetyl-CoA-carboxylase] ligase [Mucilaginibacter terrenus]|uniref:biotin--[acetyl-CoA-carboxylase] ligase n=1 Tax=Mucilaginibacter terrenus TaxID=2482727 RepID=UPI001F19C4FF|nr:biotin--[acetyl-CoA-carboxylase] ligase [Mucilaginibacter terrenus]
MSLKEVDSTNNYLKDMLSNSKPVPEGTVIMAETQFAGRGQQNNVWHAQPGKNLTFSLLLKPSFISPQQQFDLTRAISLGVYDALYPLLRDRLKIKWPNDIYFGDRKLGGMLIENMIQGGQIKSSVIGIGINVNQDNFPVESGAPVSIRQILQRDYELQQILSQICSHIEGWYLKLKAGNLTFIREKYLACLYRLNEEHLFRSNNQVFTGEITGATVIGQLVVLSNGEEKLYNLKEIEFLNKDK